MKAIVEYINDLKEKNGSDYKTAKLLNISKESISQIRKRGTIADETAIKIAELLNIDAQEVLIAAAIARSNGAVKKAWEKISQKAGLSTGFLLSFQNISPIKSLWENVICILCKIGSYPKTP